MQMSQKDYYKALTSHDARFDGVFFTCVKSTGIYCRPICPTHPPKQENCSFASSAAEAESKGYRPCLRCRPELAPLWREVSSSPAHMLCKHIEETLLADETLETVAHRFGLSERHIRRLFLDEYGVDPKRYLTTRRLLFAKQLLQDTTLPIRDVAYSSGFNTPGRLTVNMREAYGFTPERFRSGHHTTPTSTLILKADYRPPFDWAGLLEVLRGRATPLEYIEDGMYHRRVNGHTIMVTNHPEKNRLHVAIPVELSRQAHSVMQSVRQLFDLDCDPLAIHQAFNTDLRIKQLIDIYPGIRVPGAWNNFELLIRVIVGQQISVAGATTIMHRLMDRIGVEPEKLAASTPAIIAAIGMPGKRAETIHAVSKLVANSAVNLEERDPQIFYNQLVAIPGIGPWTAEYLCMRVLHWPDAFPAGDLGIQKALGTPDKKITQKQAEDLSQAWRPWRSYATMLLWRSIANKGG